MRIYEVQFYIDGPIKFNNNLNFRTTKELDIGRVFDSEIQVRTTPRGNLIYTTVLTDDIDRAEKVAALFVGKMLDILCVITNCRLEISLFENRNISYNIRTIVNINEIRRSFELARELNLNPEKNKMLRAYSWYRKGLNSENTLDKFLAFWNSISVISDAFCEENERTRSGIINRIWDCFIQVWGQSSNWPYVNGNENWVNEHNAIRNQIAHGGVTVDIEYVNNILDKITILEKVNYKFLQDFSEKLHIRV
ncbi:MAG: methylamine utilization protein MauJ [Flavobacterium sp.]